VDILIGPVGDEHGEGFGLNSKVLAIAGAPGVDKGMLTRGRYPAQLATSVSQQTAFKIGQLICVPEPEFTKS
jgi:hypothetical protein